MGKKGKSKARKRSGIKDLAPKKAKQVKGGKATLGELQISKVVDKSSAVLFQ
jgi:hypothetical protein